MNKLMIAVLALLVASTSQAKVEFFCWESTFLPPVLGAELAINDCGDATHSIGSVDSSIKERETICMHNVICRALTDDFKGFIEDIYNKKKSGASIQKNMDEKLKKTKFDNIKIDEIITMAKIPENNIKGFMSVLACKGKLKKIDNSLVSDCPPVTECQRQIIYNIGPAGTQTKADKFFKKSIGKPKESAK